MNAIVDKPSPPVQADVDRQSVAEPVGRSVLVPPAPPGRWRRRLLLGVAGVALLAGVGTYGRYYWETGRFLQSTDDAYVQADNVTASPRVAGYISEVDVTDNQPVKSGDVLARIDDRDFRTALDQAKASVASAAASIRNIDAQLALQQSTIEEDRASIEADQAALTFAAQDYQRYQDLARTGSGSVQNAQQSSSNARQKAANLAHDRAALAAAKEQVDVLRAQREAAVAAQQSDEAALQQAELNLSYTVIRAPVDGAVGDRSLRLGQYVQPGTALMQIVPMGRDLYVVANFKETQLRQMGRGETVTVDVDTFPGHSFHGNLDSLAPGSGSQFALLPPENATGNFTKIVQRVPVKIHFADDPWLDQLRPGLSVEATVDTRTRPPGPLQTLAATPGIQQRGLQEAQR
jgi:membrane fusion protein (multidrug efflux system)